MIDFKPKRDLKVYPYHVCLMGNGGEEMITFHAAFGQDLRSTLVIVTAQCDGNCKVVYDSKKRVIAAHVLTQVKKALDKWAKEGIKAEDPDKLQERIDKACDRIAKAWYL